MNQSLQASNRATQWKLRTLTLDLPDRPLLMGIINVTPDSFSDGGKFLDCRSRCGSGAAARG